MKKVLTAFLLAISLSGILVSAEGRELKGPAAVLSNSTHSSFFQMSSRHRRRHWRRHWRRRHGRRHNRG